MQWVQFFLQIQFSNEKEDCLIIIDKNCRKILGSVINNNQFSLHFNDANYNIFLLFSKKMILHPRND